MSRSRQRLDLHGAHRKINGFNLELILCRHYERKLTKDLGFQVNDVLYAIEPSAAHRLRGGMTVTSKQLEAFLNPQTNSGDSSLDHAVAEGDVKVVETPKPGDTRTGTGQTCEYYTKENKVVLSGGPPQIDDTVRGVTRGQKITYFSDDDKLIVEGEDKNLAYSRMRKH